MRYLIIGLGIYGTSLAKDLTDMGHEVIGADISAAKVEAIKDYIATAYILDTTEEAAMGVLPLKNVDLVIVTIGENFGASIKTVALLRQSSVKRIYARAIDEFHHAILEGLKVERILTPEQRAAADLMHEMELGTRVDSLRIDSDSFVLRFAAPSYFHGMPYTELIPDHLFGLKLMAASRPADATNILNLPAKRTKPIAIGTDSKETVAPNDIFTCIGTAKEYRALYRRTTDEE